MSSLRGLPRTIEIQAASAARSDIDPSIRMAIASIRRQLAGLYDAISKLQESRNEAALAENYLSINNTVIELTNKSGAARNNGEVVIKGISNNESFTTTTTAGDVNVIGVVYSDSPDGAADAIEIDAAGLVCMCGLANVKVNATIPIVRGDFLVSHTTEGVAVKAGNQDDPGVFAMALESKASGTGLIYAWINNFAQNDSIITETLTADNAGQVTLTHAPYIDAGLFAGPMCVVYDSVNDRFHFPTIIALYFASHSGCTLSSGGGAVILNSNSNFSTASSVLICIYLKDSNSPQEMIALVGSLMAALIQMTGFSGTHAGGEGYSLGTVAKTVEGAFKELHNFCYNENMAVTEYYREIGYDIDGSITGLSNAILSCASYINSDKASTIIHEVFNYLDVSSAVLLVSCAASCFNEQDISGTARMVEKAIEYSGLLLDKIKQTVSWI